VREHDYEPVKGLPGLLPRGEAVLWQGAPDWFRLARGAFLGDWVAIYFGALMAWRLADNLAQGAGFTAAFAHMLWLGLVGAVALAVIGVLAFVTARTTIYTITNRRVVLRIGAALTVTVNAPFKRIAGAALRRVSGEAGDVVLSVGGADRFSYPMLWPHARPWRMGRPEPMLRALPDAAQAAAVLAQALQAYQAEFGMDLSEAATAPGAAPVKKPGLARPSGGAVAAE